MSDDADHKAWVVANSAMVDADIAFLEGIKAFEKENPFTPYHIMLDRLNGLRTAQAEARKVHDKILSDMIDKKMYSVKK